MKAETKKPVVKKAKGAYTLEVSVNDVNYEGTGESMVDILSKFVTSQDFPFSIKTRVFMKFSDGKKEGIQRYSAMVARRIFKVLASKTSALEIQARKMEERMA